MLNVYMLAVCYILFYTINNLYQKQIYHRPYGCCGALGGGKPWLVPVPLRIGGQNLCRTSLYRQPGLLVRQTRGGNWPKGHGKSIEVEANTRICPAAMGPFSSLYIIVCQFNSYRDRIQQRDDYNVAFFTHIWFGSSQCSCSFTIFNYCCYIEVCEMSVTWGSEQNRKF